jgi:hypothetical protein
VLALAAVALAAATPAYATPETAMRAAARDAVDAIPQARVTRLRVSCIGGLWEVGERGTCEGGFVVRRGERRAVYRLTWRSRTLRTSATTVDAKVDATRRAGRGLPERLTAAATWIGDEPPAERTDHADLVLDRGEEQTLSRTTWVAFPRPFWWGQAYGEGPVTIVGGSNYGYDLPPGALCAVELDVTAAIAADPPAERDGRLYERDDIEGQPIAARTDDGAGTTTWLLEPRYGAAKSVRAGPAPPAIGPPELDTLVVTAYVTSELDRFGAPDRDGYPLLETSREQERRCKALTARNAAALIPRALAEARPVERRRPPRPDPDDEAQIPLEPAR